MKKKKRVDSVVHLTRRQVVAQLRQAVKNQCNITLEKFVADYRTGKIDHDDYDGVLSIIILASLLNEDDEFYLRA
jgi:hypothetical protein